MLIIVPAGDLPALSEILEEHEVFDIWNSDVHEGRALTHTLISSEHTEPASDIITSRFGTHTGFRLILLPVEATIPKPQEPRAQPTAASKENEINRTVTPGRISREELYEDIAGGSRLSWTFTVTVALSTLVATFGLIRNDTAIIIGAMVIAPLLGPNVSLSLASTLGDWKLARRSIKTLLTGILIAGILSITIGALFTVPLDVPAIISRTHVSIGDIVLALSAGTAGALAFTTGIPTAVIGVMVAVALLPPLVVTGLLAGSLNLQLALNSLALLLINITCVNLAGVVTFFAQKIHPRKWWKAEHAKKSIRIAIALWLAMLLILSAVILFLYEVS